jgi:ribosomal protein L37E
MTCPHCHSAEFTEVPAAEPGAAGSLLRRWWGRRPGAQAPVLQRRCRSCQTLYVPGDPVDEDEKRIEARRARMEERISGFRDSAEGGRLPEMDAESGPVGAPPTPGKAPPQPYRAPSLKELSEAAAGIRLQEPEGVKCPRCGHFAFLVRTPESRCAGCGRVYAKMDEEARTARQEANRRP